MTDESDTVRKINRLYELWGYEGADIAATPKPTEAAAPGAPADPAKPCVFKMSVADPMETLRDGCFSDEEFTDYGDDDFEYIDDRDPEQVEKVRLYLEAIEDTEELSQAFFDNSWWVIPALHDELRRACSGSGELSRFLARTVGFEFIIGLARSLAYRGDGPLSTPLTFTSQPPSEPTWNEEVITLNAPCREDAVQLSGCYSFMMH